MFSILRFGMPEIMEQIFEEALDDTTFEMLTRRMAPAGTPVGPRIREPKRRKMGAATVSRMVMFEMETSSMTAPSTLRMAKPKQPSKTQFEMVMFLLLSLSAA
jgi:hypothetical protein